MIGWLMVAGVLAIFALMFVRYVREENRRNEAWIESMREMGRRCPACMGMGFYMAEGAPTCEVCKGRGTLHGDPSPEAVGAGLVSAASGDPVARETTPPTPASEQTAERLKDDA